MGTEKPKCVYATQNITHSVCRMAQRQLEFTEKKPITTVHPYCIDPYDCPCLSARKMEEVTKVCLRDVGPHLVCVLCGGYIIQATTVQECLHSFCRSCLVRYLETSEVCPICDVTLHKDRPLQNIRDDPLLQSLIFKLVPGLYHREMKNRRDFYDSHVTETNSDESSDSDSSSRDHFLGMSGGNLQSHVYPDVTPPDSEISLCLQLSDRPPPYKHRPLKKLKVKDSSVLDRRFLLCPASFPVRLLKKFIRGKFELSEKQEISVYYSEERLSDACTLMDVCYIYQWNKMAPLQLFYTVTDKIPERAVSEKEAVISQSKHSKVKKRTPKKPKDLKVRRSAIAVAEDTMQFSKRKGISSSTFAKTVKQSSIVPVKSHKKHPSKMLSERSASIRKTSTKKVPCKAVMAASSKRGSRATAEHRRRKKRKGPPVDSVLVRTKNFVKRMKPKKNDLPSLKGSVRESDEHAKCNVQVYDSNRVQEEDSYVDALKPAKSGSVPISTEIKLTKKLEGSQGNYRSDTSSATAASQGDKVTEQNSDNVRHEQYVDCKLNQITETQISAAESITEADIIDITQTVGHGDLESESYSRSLGAASQKNTVKPVATTPTPPSCYELSVLKAQKRDSLRQGKGKRSARTDKGKESVKQTPPKSKTGGENSFDESDADPPPMEICTDADDDQLRCGNEDDIAPKEKDSDHSESGICQGQNNLNLLAEAAGLSSSTNSLTTENQQFSIDNDTSRLVCASDNLHQSADTHDVGKAGLDSGTVCSENKNDTCAKEDNESQSYEHRINLYKSEKGISEEPMVSNDTFQSQYTQCADNSNIGFSALKTTDNVVKEQDSTNKVSSSVPNDFQGILPCVSVFDQDSIAVGDQQGIIYRQNAVHVKSVEVQTEGTPIEMTSPILTKAMTGTHNYTSTSDIKPIDSEINSMSQTQENNDHNDMFLSTSMARNVEHSAQSKCETEANTMKSNFPVTLSTSVFENKSKDSLSVSAGVQQDIVETSDNNEARSINSHENQQLRKHNGPNLTENQFNDKLETDKSVSYPIQSIVSDKCGSNRAGDYSPSDGKKNQISFAKKYRCPTRLGKTDNKSHSLKSDRNKLSRKSSQDNSDPYIFTADDNHNYVNGTSHSEERKSPIGATPRNALAFLEEYVNYVHNSQNSDEISKHLGSDRVFNQQVITSQSSQNKSDEGVAGGHVILGTLTLPRAYIPLKDIASAAAIQKKKVQNEYPPVLQGARMQHSDVNKIVNVIKEPEEESGHTFTVDGKKIPPLKLKLTKSSQNGPSNTKQKTSPVKRPVSTRVNKTSKKVSAASPQKKGEINSQLEPEEGQPRIFLRISKANIPSINRSLSANDSNYERHNVNDHIKAEVDSPVKQAKLISFADTKLAFSQSHPITCVATCSVDVKNKDSKQVTEISQVIASGTNQYNHSNIWKDGDSSPSKTRDTSMINCVQPAKIRSKIQRSMSLPGATKAMVGPSLTSTTTNTTAVSGLGLGISTGVPDKGLRNRANDHDKNTATVLTRHGDNTPLMKGTRLLKSSVTVVSTYNSPITDTPSNVSPTQILAKTRNETTPAGNNTTINYQMAPRNSLSQCSGSINVTTAKPMNVKSSQRTGGISQVFTVSPSVFINANSTVPTVLSLSQIEALNQYLSSTNTAIAVSSSQIATCKVPTTQNSLSSPLVTSPIVTELASTSQIVQMLLSTPPIATSVIPATQTCVASQTDIASKCKLDYTTVTNAARLGKSPHLISIQGGQHISPITVNRQQANVNTLSIPAASLKLPLPVKRKLSTLNTVGPAKIIRLPVQARFSVPESQKAGLATATALTTIANPSQNASLLTSNPVTAQNPQPAGTRIPLSSVKEVKSPSSNVQPRLIKGAKEDQVTCDQKGSNDNSIVTVSPCDVTILGRVGQLVNTSSTSDTVPTLTSSTSSKTNTPAVQSQYIALLPKGGSQNPASCPGHQPNFTLLNTMLTNAMLTNTVTTTRAGEILRQAANTSTRCMNSDAEVQLPVSKNLSARQGNTEMSRITQYPQGIPCTEPIPGQYTTALLCTATTNVTSSTSGVKPFSVPSTNTAGAIRLISLLSGDSKKSTTNSISSMNSLKPALNTNKTHADSVQFCPINSSCLAAHFQSKPIKSDSSLTPAVPPCQVATILSQPTTCDISSQHSLTSSISGETSTSTPTAQSLLPNSTVPSVTTNPCNSLSGVQTTLQVSHNPSSAMTPIATSVLPLTQVYLGARHFLPPHISYHGIVYPGNGIMMMNGQPRLMSQQSGNCVIGQPAPNRIPVNGNHTGEVQANTDQLPANGYDAPLELTTKKYTSAETLSCE